MDTGNKCDADGSAVKRAYRTHLAVTAIDTATSTDYDGPTFVHGYAGGSGAPIVDEMDTGCISGTFNCSIIIN